MRNLRIIVNKLYKGNNIINIKDLRYLPRWVVLLIDIFFLFITTILSYAILVQVGIYPMSEYKFRYISTGIIILHIACMYIFKTYAGVIRHSTFIDLFKIMISNISVVVVVVLVNLFWIYFYDDKIILNTFIILYFLISFILLFIFRFTVKEVFNLLNEFTRTRLTKNVFMLGVSPDSIAVARAIIDNPNVSYQVRGFISTQNNIKENARILSKKVVSKQNFINALDSDNKLHGVIIVENSVSKEELEEWVNLLLEKGINLLKAPDVKRINKGNSQNFIKVVEIEDLLNREPIKIDNHSIKLLHQNKNVLITGGAGSVGQEIAKQVASYDPKLIVILDQAETPLYQIALEIKEQFPHIEFKFILADISVQNKIKDVFDEFNLDIVYHAAAYKHVPLVEDNPHEAVRVNILGTRNVALLAYQYKVERFVMVSTDKAVNPTNVMGASKRSAELFVQSLQNLENNKTKYITTRFGNVLGSNGSVIPHFRKQIEKGGPLTITHPDIVRYFMTISEACELVLNAGTIGNGGEIFVFDMGSPVKIYDLAIRMIKLSGFEPHKDISIKFIGLRPGEKLYEELLSDNTKTLPTSHQKILISKDPTMDYSEINNLVNEIEEVSIKQDKIEIVKVLKKIVKEFKSNNSIFESLDN